MSLSKRFVQLCRADFNAVLDQLEDPEDTLKQAIRDMEEQLDQQTTEFEQQQQKLNYATAQEQELQIQLAKLNAEISLCFDSEKHDLLHMSVRRKLTHEQLQVQAQKHITELKQTLNLQEKALQKQSQQLADMQQKARVFLTITKKEAVDYSDFQNQAIPGVSDGDVELAILREKQLRAEAGRSA